MNNSNHLETQLRSWTPRAPSPNLRERLFHSTSDATGAQAAAVAVAAPEVPRVSWQWFAPSTALVLLTTFLLGGHSGVLGLSSIPSPGVIASAALAQPDLSTYYVSARHSENNTPVVGVAWTAARVAFSGTPTNDLIH